MVVVRRHGGGEEGEQDQGSGEEEREDQEREPLGLLVERLPMSGAVFVHGRIGGGGSRRDVCRNGKKGRTFADTQILFFFMGFQDLEVMECFDGFAATKRVAGSAAVMIVYYCVVPSVAS